MTIYNKLPTGYVKPLEKKKDELTLIKHGSVTEITLGDKKFHVHDPVRMEGIISLVERHETRIFELSQSNSTLIQQVRELTNTVRILRSDIQKLQDLIKQNGQFL